ncbi:winged helix-turn-helix transcriptional regulator [Streptomyces sp. NPDC002680]|uniref:winged helix-turn-helix transcriptional regulator n=1 Tax=Streptomyces sp. NPDC002680 TaxID=3364659 RepID=UPI00367A6AEA
MHPQFAHLPRLDLPERVVELPDLHARHYPADGVGAGEVLVGAQARDQADLGHGVVRTSELSLLTRRRPRSMAHTLQVIGDRWNSLILRSSLHGIKRFDDFPTDLGIAESVLSQRLSRLTELGVLTQRGYQVNPPRHEYVFTEKGLALYPICLSMVVWGKRWLPSDGGPGTVLEHKPCGHSVEPVLVCGARQVHVSPDTIT